MHQRIKSTQNFELAKKANEQALRYDKNNMNEQHNNININDKEKYDSALFNTNIVFMNVHTYRDQMHMLIPTPRKEI